MSQYQEKGSIETGVFFDENAHAVIHSGISQRTPLKNTAIRNTQDLMYRWTGLTPNEHFSAPNVMLQGTCAIVTHNDENEAFLEQRLKDCGEPRHGSPDERRMFKTAPNVVRAEGFTGPRAAVFLRTYARTGQKA